MLCVCVCVFVFDSFHLDSLMASISRHLLFTPNLQRRPAPSEKPRPDNRGLETSPWRLGPSSSLFEIIAFCVLRHFHRHVILTNSCMSPLDGRSDSCGPSRGWADFDLGQNLWPGGNHKSFRRCASITFYYAWLYGSEIAATDHNSLTAIVRCVRGTGPQIVLILKGSLQGLFNAMEDHGRLVWCICWRDGKHDLWRCSSQNGWVCC